MSADDGGSGAGPERDEAGVPPPRPRRRSWRNDSSLFRGTLAAALLVAGGIAAWLWLSSGDGTDQDPVPVDTLPPAAASGPDDSRDGAAADTALDLPPLSASDEFLRRTAEELSSRPGWARWLATEDLVRRFVASVVQVASGTSPASRLEPLEPDAPFRVRQEGDDAYIHPASYERYDLPVAVFVSLDTRGTARLYRQLHPLFEEAYRELGFEEGTFDQALARAVDRLLAVDVPEGPVEVYRDEGVWLYRDPALESLSPAAKHLIRMGPENARRVQAKLRELADVIGLPVERGRTSSP